MSLFFRQEPFGYLRYHKQAIKSINLKDQPTINSLNFKVPPIVSLAGLDQTPREQDRRKQAPGWERLDARHSAAAARAVSMQGGHRKIQ